MPKVKELSLQGFKSFANALTITYPTGITAIVGPNGSGKSNVADAIRWVLGEQRMTSLRGSTNEDMIFAGSKSRPRAGMARVALTFDNVDGWLPVDFAEVTVERRTYRDGKSDYMLNGSKIRLTDMRDLLGRASLGRDAYLTIGQGLVDQVLSLRTSERLALFEQAAGIVPYRRRRVASVRNLEKTARNLERVQDIVGEIEPRLQQLKQQVTKAKQHAELYEELRRRRRIWYGYRWGKELEKITAARQRLLYRQEKVTQHQEELTKLTAQIADLRQRLSAERNRLVELHHVSSVSHAEIEKVQRELAVWQERHRLLQERQAESRANLIPLQTALEAGTEDLTGLQVRLAAAVQQLQAGTESLTTLEAEYQQLSTQRHTLLRQQSVLQARALENRHQLADRQSRLKQLDEHAAQLSSRIEQLQAALSSTAQRRQAQQALVGKSRQQLATQEEKLAALEGERERIQTARTVAQTNIEQLRRRLGDQQGDYQQLSARLAALERLKEEGAGLYEGVRALLQAVEKGHLQGLPGTFASMIQVPPELDRAMEIALGAKIQSVVARSWQDANHAIQWLKKHHAGRATFLPLDNLRPSRPLPVPAGTGILGLAANLVKYDDPDLRPAVQLLLGRIAVVERLEAARALHQRLHGGFQIVTLEGEILRSGGTLTGGQVRRQRRGGSLLVRERELRQLPPQVQQCQQAVKELRAEIQEQETQERALSTELRSAIKLQRELERARQAANRYLESQANKLEKSFQETEWQRQLLAEAAQEQSQLGSQRTRLARGQQTAREQLDQAETSLAVIARSLVELSEAQINETVAEQRTCVALLKQDAENRRILQDTRASENQHLSERLTEQKRHSQERTSALAALSVQLSELQLHYEEVRTAAGEISMQIPAIEAQVRTLEQEQQEQESAVDVIRRHRRDAEQRLSRAEISFSRQQDKVQSLRAEIESRLDIVIMEIPEALSAQQPLPLSASTVPFPIILQLPDGIATEIRDLQTQIRRLEPVNPTAQKEYAQLLERHTFLGEQVNDLQTASAHLNQIISELDAMMAIAFSSTFKAIATEFADIFKLLFNGGGANLAIFRQNDEIAGVEITARPPGKRTSGLGMLSGGERTLTAVALLFAVMRISPTPFCILDEVDAMLDEANVGRFRSLLRELGKQTQFIVITHNRGTVEVADTIYGVSMGEDGVSQLLSLSLEDLPPSEIV
ncbi:MAG: chromosome segregation protein SMC [Chloroflexota bacterium]|nr:chromosome segregation protein SMC [Chloroflexota bacterium]